MSKEFNNIFHLLFDMSNAHLTSICVLDWMKFKCTLSHDKLSSFTFERWTKPCNHMYNQPTQNCNPKTCFVHIQPLEAMSNTNSIDNSVKSNPKNVQWLEYDSYQLLPTHVKYQEGLQDHK